MYAWDKGLFLNHSLGLGFGSISYFENVYFPYRPSIRWPAPKLEPKPKPWFLKRPMLTIILYVCCHLVYQSRQPLKDVILISTHHYCLVTSNYTNLTCVSTITQESVDCISAATIIFTRRALTLVDIRLTVVSAVTWSTGTFITVV